MIAKDKNIRELVKIFNISVLKFKTSYYRRTRHWNKNYAKSRPETFLQTALIKKPSNRRLKELKQTNNEITFKEVEKALEIGIKTIKTENISPLKKTKIQS